MTNLIILLKLAEERSVTQQRAWVKVRLMFANFIFTELLLALSGAG